MGKCQPASQRTGVAELQKSEGSDLNCTRIQWARANYQLSCSLLEIADDFGCHQRCFRALTGGGSAMVEASGETKLFGLVIATQRSTLESPREPLKLPGLGPPPVEMLR